LLEASTTRFETPELSLGYASTLLSISVRSFQFDGTTNALGNIYNAQLKVTPHNTKSMLYVYAKDASE